MIFSKFSMKTVKRDTSSSCCFSRISEIFTPDANPIHGYSAFPFSVVRSISNTSVTRSIITLLGFIPQILSVRTFPEIRKSIISWITIPMITFFWPDTSHNKPCKSLRKIKSFTFDSYGNIAKRITISGDSSSATSIPVSSSIVSVSPSKYSSIWVIVKDGFHKIHGEIYLLCHVQSLRCATRMDVAQYTLDYNRGIN